MNLIAATTTTKGLRVASQLDTNQYPKGVKVPDKELAKVKIEPDEFHGDWNYKILPRKR